VVTSIAVLAWVVSSMFAWRRIYIRAKREQWKGDHGVFASGSVFFSALVWPFFYLVRIMMWFYSTVIARETPDERKARLDAIAERCIAENEKFLAGSTSLPGPSSGQEICGTETLPHTRSEPGARCRRCGARGWLPVLSDKWRPSPEWVEAHGMRYPL
jgi:hypothetical protein